MKAPTISNPDPPSNIVSHHPEFILDYHIQHLLFQLNVLELDQWPHEDPLEDGLTIPEEQETRVKETITRYAEELSKEA